MRQPIGMKRRSIPKGMEGSEFQPPGRVVRSIFMGCILKGMMPKATRILLASWAVLSAFGLAAQSLSGPGDLSLVQAGGITSVGVGVTDAGDFRDELSTAEDPTLLTTNLGEEYAVKTILDYWGSRVSVDLLQGVYGVSRFDPGDPPLFIAHGTEDETVPYFNALLLQATWNNTGVPYVLHTLQGAGHGPWDATVDDAEGNPQTLLELAFDFITEQQALQVD